jgi:hypothetical protein
VQFKLCYGEKDEWQMANCQCHRAGPALAGDSVMGKVEGNSSLSLGSCGSPFCSVLCTLTPEPGHLPREAG